jgi:hypothetical protein
MEMPEAAINETEVEILKMFPGTEDCAILLSTGSKGWLLVMQNLSYPTQHKACPVLPFFIFQF